MINEKLLKEEATFKVSYYSSYKDWKLMANFSYWPFFVSVILLILSAIFITRSAVTVFLLFFSGFMTFFCAFVTRFYANSILTVTEAGLKITRKAKIINVSWSDMSNMAFVVPRHGASYLEIILVVYKNNNDVEYLFVESLYFKTAKSRVKEMKVPLEKCFKNYKFIIHKSDFEPILLNKKLGYPNMLT